MNAMVGDPKPMLHQDLHIRRPAVQPTMENLVHESRIMGLILLYHEENHMDNQLHVPSQLPAIEQQHASSIVNSTPVSNQVAIPQQITSLDDIRLAYQTAVSIWTYEGNLIWSKYNAMLVANSIILAIIGFTISAPNMPVLFSVATPLAGMALCVLWLLLTRRGFEYHRYWVLAARELEEQHLAPAIKTISRGGRLIDGRPVELSIDGKTRVYRLDSISSFLSASWNSYIVIGIFFVLYVIFLFSR